MAGYITAEGYNVSMRTRRIWDVEKNIALKFIEICEKHNLTYYAFAGTLLGAVRHRGFIPWDTDMDFAMKREDFDRFCEIAGREIEEPLFLQTDESDTDNFFGTKVRIRDSRTTGVEAKDLKRRSNWGIWIDILCLDYLSEDEGQREAQLSSIEWYRRVLMQDMYGENVPEYDGYSYKQRIIYKYYARKLGRAGILKGYREACMLCEKSQGKSSLLCRLTPTTKLENIRAFMACDFDKTVELEFDGIKIKAPAGYDRILTMYYGDYKSLLPENARNRRDGTILDPDSPFTDYQHKLMDIFKDAEGKTLVLFGAGNMVGSYLAEHGAAHRPAFIVDNGKSKWGRIFSGFMVYPPEKLLEIPREQLRVIICNIYYPEISKQLRDMGIYDYYLYAENLNVLDQTVFPDRLEYTEDEGDITEETEIVEFTGGGIGKGIDTATGRLSNADDKVMTTFKLYKLNKGDIIEAVNPDYEFCTATYSENIDGRLIYTYCYQEEENWTAYNHDLNDKDGYSSRYVARDSRYARIQLRRLDGGPIPSIAESEELVRIRHRVSSQRDNNTNIDIFADEIRETSTAILKEKEKGKDKSITVALLADTHYVIGGTWDDTVNNLKEVNDQVHFDCAVHLGDLTDGLSTKAIAAEYAGKVLDDMRSLNIPVYPVIGNHDTNYFKGNPDVLTNEEQVALYYKNIDPEITKPWYYRDYSSIGLRMVFLSSFDSKQTIRYGFDDEEVEWLDKIIRETPLNMKILVFAHIPLLPKMHYWSKEIRNSERVLSILKKTSENEGRILGYIHGHNHCDQINTEHGFPIVSVGCNKPEYFTDYKPEGAITYKREIGTVTQDLWDGVVITPSLGRLSFVRFGAGEDRALHSTSVEPSL